MLPLACTLQVIRYAVNYIQTLISYIIIAGDINIDSLTSNREQVALNELQASHDLQRLTLPPTRIAAIFQYYMHRPSAMQTGCVQHWALRTHLPKILYNPPSQNI